MRTDQDLTGVKTVKGFATIDNVALINVEGTGMVGVQVPLHPGPVSASVMAGVPMFALGMRISQPCAELGCQLPWHLSGLE